MFVSRVENKHIEPGRAAYRCTECAIAEKQMWGIRCFTGGLVLCNNCLKTLRAKIDRLALLVTEGVVL